MQAYTIFGYDADTCSSFRIETPHLDHDLTLTELWLYVLRDRLKRPSIMIEEVDQCIEELGDDMMDYNIVAVIEDYVQCVFDQLTD